ncbi:hypothetical protein D3C85_1272410 [compost metagenome]
MDGAAGGHATLEGGGDLLGQARDGFMDTRRSSGSTAFHSEERLGDGNGDLVVGVGDDGAVAFDHAQLAGRGGSQILVGIGGLGRYGLRVLASGVGLHGVLHDLYLCNGARVAFIAFSQRHTHGRGPGAKTWCYEAEGQDSSAFLALQVNHHGVETGRGNTIPSGGRCSRRTCFRAPVTFFVSWAGTTRGWRMVGDLTHVTHRWSGSEKACSA